MDEEIRVRPVPTANGNGDEGASSPPTGTNTGSSLPTRAAIGSILRTAAATEDSSLSMQAAKIEGNSLPTPATATAGNDLPTRFVTTGDNSLPTQATVQRESSGRASQFYEPIESGTSTSQILLPVEGYHTTAQPLLPADAGGVAVASVQPYISSATELPSRSKPRLGLAGLLVVLLAALAAAAFLVGVPRGGSTAVDIHSAGTATSSPNNAPAANTTPGGANAANDLTPAAATPATGGANAPSDVRPVPNGTEAADLPGVAVPDEGAEHVPEGSVIHYKSTPPSNGPHYPTTATYGFSLKTIPDGNLVHSLEHGAIVLYYKPGVDAATAQELRDLFTRLRPSKYGKVKLIVAPYANLQVPLEIAAWRRVEPLTTFNFDRIRAFYEAFVDKGPEDIP
ncbi:MAG: DUF3105 domain-containing protein [Chloroflexota bacterium]|nr:DUF3105 domain-containing protein [Chloroflexota bacterium]